MTVTARNKYFTGVGRRKTAVAQVRVLAGDGRFILNGKQGEQPLKLKRVFETVGKSGQLDVEVVARGGGFTSTVDAVAMGTARALVELNPDFKQALRKAGFLTRDARIKERKKPGLKKARKAPQWAKR
ncbi:30S ribosomal protein S9 [Candidatus Berkelbacteria bacterium RIFCSPLOWO2_01_FULL_50_28]|uniref:Small ribosomal subunit protein uS9 n=1 Tax=Candidatus Berkelbacteria bacterium RIFCSPLOWO2_01_FULL_50_28 TaxID=1797471 RepID=A0A1F5EBU9_9BACT|nr:MAG: 30S ribosomal protein S9 [Candidatus Berkelbacteria bacterium RIFCSPHIGHO2_01_FULL_50_36]OGD64887.1 MAG: 30S ribosomal protein S9 [Candidatus Berkelbacteria bacterium RIFCSPLOWO2_01_FULL_50_28]